MVYEKRVLWRISGPKRGEVVGEWRKLHNEGLNDLYFLRSIVRVIKSRRLRLAGHVAHTRGEVYTEFCWGNLRERDHLEVPSVDGRVILNWIFGKWQDGLDCSGSGQGQVAGISECGKETSGSIKCGEFD